MFDSAIAAIHDLRHEPDDDLAYNESTYYNFASPAAGVSGWLRVAIQANQQVAQSTICLFLPDGKITFAYTRGVAPAPRQFAAGPLSISIDTPHRQQTLTYRGAVAILADGRAMQDPKRALASAPVAQAVVELEVHGRGDSLGHDGSDRSSAADPTMAVGHYQQFVSVTGTVGVGDECWPISGNGLRDHSWGPRDWAGPLYYRWVTAAFDDGTAAMGMELAARGGQLTRGGLLHVDGRSAAARLTELSVDWTADHYQRDVQLSFETPAGLKHVVGTASANSFIPLRHRKRSADGSESTTRISYAAFTFECDGCHGAGFLEALDQVVDGVPVTTAPPSPRVH